MRIHNIIFNNFYNFYFFDLIVFTPKLTSNSLLFSFFAYHMQCTTSKLINYSFIDKLINYSFIDKLIIY